MAFFKQVVRKTVCQLQRPKPNNSKQDYMSFEHDIQIWLITNKIISVYPVYFVHVAVVSNGHPNCSFIPSNNK